MLKRRLQLGNLHFLSSGEVFIIFAIVTPIEWNCQTKKLQRFAVFICGREIV